MSCVRRERWTEDLTLDFDPGDTLRGASCQFSVRCLMKSMTTHSFLNISKLLLLYCSAVD